MRGLKIGLTLCFLLAWNSIASASAYFKSYDFSVARPTATLHILPGFKTFQQTTDYSCAAVCVQMLESYAGRVVHSEEELIKLIDINPHKGVSTDQLAKFLAKQGWQVEKSSSKKPLNSYEDFVEFVEQNIVNKLPIFVESSLWGGHWRLIIGFDKRGNDVTGDDVLILADPMDIADDVRDGYTIVNAGQFYYSWFDGNFGPMRRLRQWVVAKQVQAVQHLCSNLYNKANERKRFIWQRRV